MIEQLALGVQNTLAVRKGSRVIHAGEALCKQGGEAWPLYQKEYQVFQIASNQEIVVVAHRRQDASPD